MCHLWSKSLYPYPYLHTSSINFSFHPHFSSPKKIQNQPKPKIASVKDNKPAFLRKLLAAYLPNFSLCQVRRYKWRIKLAGDQLCFCSTSPIWFDESSWVTARIAKHCNVAFNCAKQAWSRATTKEEAGAGVPVPSWQSPAVSAIFRKPPATADLCVTEPRHQLAYWGLLRLFESICKPSVGHESALELEHSFFLLWCLEELTLLRLYLPQQITQCNRRGPLEWHKNCRVPCISWDLPQMSSILVLRAECQ